MAKRSPTLPKPLNFKTGPLRGGINIAEPPQDIKTQESTDLINVRFSAGKIATRDGFIGKYFGSDEAIQYIELVYQSDGSLSALAALAVTKIWQVASGDTVAKPVRIRGITTITGDTHNGTATIDDLSAADYAKVQVGSYIEHADIPAGTRILYKEGGDIIMDANSTADNNDVTITVRYEMVLTTDPDNDQFQVDAGQGTYTGHAINSKAIYPTTGYADILAFTNQADGVFVLLPASDGDPLIAEQIYDAASVGLAGARAVAIFDNKLLVGGSSSSKLELLWSGVGVFDDFDPASDPTAGSQLLGDGIDWIQTIRRMGEYCIVYKERSIYIGRKTFITDPPIDFQPAPGQGIGCAAPMSIGDLGEEHLFLGWDNVYMFSLSGIEAFGDRIKDWLFGYEGEYGIVPSHVNRCIGIIAEEFDEYWLFTPTGRFPDVTNIVVRGDMSFAYITGDTTNADATVSDISAADIALLKIGDIIEGSDIPSDAVIYTIGTTTLEMSARATGANNDITITCGNDDGWAVSADGNGSVSTQSSGSKFGGLFQRLTFSTGTYVTYTLDQADFGSNLGAGNLISVLIWLKVSGESDITITYTEQDNAGVDGTDHTYSLSAFDEESFYPVIFSFTTSDADFEKLKVAIKLETADETLDIDAIQIIDITDLEDDEVYTDDAGYQAPGYTGADGEQKLIPFIVDTCGPWLCDSVWVYNFKYDCWTLWRLPLCGFGYDAISSSITIADLTGTVADITWRYDDRLVEDLAPTNLIAEVSGQIYEVSRAYALDYQGLLDSPVVCWWVSKDFDLGNPDVDKTLSRVTILHETSHYATSLLVAASTDSGETWTEQTVTVRTGYTHTFADFVVTGPQVRFRVRANASGIEIRGYTVKIIPRGETNEY